MEVATQVEVRLVAFRGVFAARRRGWFVSFGLKGAEVGLDLLIGLLDLGLVEAVRFEGLL